MEPWARDFAQKEMWEKDARGRTFELGFKNERDFTKEAISSKHEDAEYVEEQQVAIHSN